ncbi:MAG: dihydrolipoamide acetyltransferase family protein [Myxococcota bacterium]
MPTVVEMPRLSDTMREGTVASWLKEEGDAVAAGDELAEIETDKAVQAFESFDEGVLLKILVPAGETVPLGAPIAVLGEEGEDVSELIPELEQRVKDALAQLEAEEAAPEPAEEEEEPEEEPAEEAPEPEPEPTTGPPEAPPARSPGPREVPVDERGVRVKASPVARRIAEDKGIDLLTVRGSGPHGRILKRDVEDLEPTHAVRPGLAGPARQDEEVRVTQMRKTIAKRLVQAKQSAPHFYLTVTCRCDALVDLRREINDSQDAVKISYNDLIMRACVVTLLDHPEVNAGWEGKVIRRFGPVHLGFAVAMEEGLITPVIRNADGIGLLDMAVRTREMAERARDGALEESEYQGNSFCVSNLGMYGIEHFTAIINPPAACILAVGALRDEVVVEDGEVRPAKVMTLTMSCDHRVVDGAMGAAFMKDLKANIERPLNLLL